MSDEPSVILSTTNLLLSRLSDSAYVGEWTHLIAEQREGRSSEQFQSIVIFRLGKEWLGLSTLVFFDVSENRIVRSIPHRGHVLRGLANIRGQLHLCVSLEKLLEIEPLESDLEHGQSRMMTIEYNEQKWVFAVDEILGIFSWKNDALQNIPVTLFKSAHNYLKGALQIEGKHVSLLDEELLFCGLQRSLS